MSLKHGGRNAEILVMTQVAALHSDSSNGFFGWMFKNPNADNRYVCGVTPTHIFFSSRFAKQMKRVETALAAGDNGALLAISGVTSYARSEVNALRYVAEQQRMYVVQGDKEKWHPMMPQIFGALDAVMPEAPMVSEQYSSAGMKADRYFVAVFPLILIGLHWMSNNTDTSGVRRGRAIIAALEQWPVAVFYPLMIFASVVAVVWAHTRNKKPAQALAMYFAGARQLTNSVE